MRIAICRLLVIENKKYANCEFIILLLDRHLTVYKKNRKTKQASDLKGGHNEWSGTPRYPRHMACLKKNVINNICIFLSFMWQLNAKL